jgi:predicted RNA-binding Zn-ribbon protein involved in translation (DUF1610 family)
VLFGVLLYWLLGFVLRDIGTWPGPDYAALERAMVDAQALREADQVKVEIEDVSRSITEQQQQQTLLRDSAANAERTMNQLLELSRRALEQNQPPAPEDAQALIESRRLFLTNQTRYQEFHERISVLNGQLRELEARRRTNQNVIEAQRRPVQAEFARQMNRHQLRIAGVKLAFLLPLLALAVWLFLRKRNSMYAPLIYGLGVVTLVRVGWVIHEHFPRRYFKYVLIGAALLVVARVLVYLLRMTSHPKTDWLLRQYREAYQHFLCPVCRYPIRRGPLKYLFWDRRSLKKVTTIAASGPPVAEEPYTCPVCGTRLFEECPACRNIRHSLLPSCTRCGAEKGPLDDFATR